MRLTRRGYGALAIAGAAVLLRVVGGYPALDAVAAPVVAAVAAGAVQVRRADAPTVERSRPRRGFAGETRTVSLTVSGSGVATVADRLPDGLSGSGTVDRSLPATVEYEVTYQRRGVYDIGPTGVTVRDALGLVETAHRCTDTTEVVVYPRVHSLAADATFARTLGPQTDDRTEFDRLREYVPGDRLRDVHWPTSAKYDELLVTEFSDPTDESAIAVAAAGDPSMADDLASAAATLVVGAIRAGLAVELVLPDAALSRGYGETHRRRALELLARTEGGEVDEDAWTTADVRVRADEAGVTVSLGAEDHPIEELTGARENPLVSEASV